MDREAPALRVLIVGWHGSRERHLRPLARHDASHHRADVITHVPRTFRAMRSADGWVEEARPIAERLAHAHAARPLPLVIHAFSNAGFWTTAALLDQLSPELRAAHAGTVIDSAPGFPPRVSPSFTARYATRAMLPGLLARLGLKASHSHPVLGPPFAAFLYAWHLIAPAQVRFMEGSLARMRDAHRDRALLLVWGGRDELVLPEYVEAFADDCERSGAPLTRLYFPDGEHVRHLVTHRRDYLAARDRFLEERIVRS